MNLKDLSERAPVIGAFLIFIGFLKLYLYYNHWGVNISHYLDFSEIILSFLNDINTMLFFIVIMVVQTTLSMAMINSFDRKIEKSELARIADEKKVNIEVQKADSNLDINEKEKFKGIMVLVEEALSGNSGIYISLIVTLVFAILFFVFTNMTFLYFTFLSSLQLVLFIIDVGLGIKDEKVLMQTAIATIMVVFTLCSAKYQSYQTESSSKKYVFYKNNKEVITTDKNLLYLGKTNNYYFYYDKKKNVSFVLPSSSINETFQIN